jgi:hypothetical protein
MSYASPLIRSGFDDIPFRILTSGNRPTIADWEVQDYVSERKVASSNQVDVQVMGSGLATVTWTLAFDERAAFLAFRRRRQTLGTLRLPYGIQTLSDEVWVDAGGKRWDLLHLCRPSELRNIASYLGGRVDVDVTFSRAWDPLTDRAEVP